MAVKMYSSGITITVNEVDISFFKRAGYVVVEEEKAAEKKPEKATPAKVPAAKSEKPTEPKKE